MSAPTDSRLRMVIPPAPWTRAMEDGSVSAPGVSWYTDSSVDRAPERFVASQEADVGENGLRRIVLDRLAGKPAVALPVFFGREHMQRNVLVRADSPLQHPRDLVGKRVGSWLTIQSGTAAAVLMVLEQAYGVPVTEIHWYMGDPSTLPENRMGLNLAPGPTEAETIPGLLRGEFDAIIVTTGPRYWSMFGGGPSHGGGELPAGVRVLGGDPEEIAGVYRRTGLYIISDIVVLRQALAMARPEVAPLLVDAFVAANQRTANYRAPDEEALAQREITLLGDDPHQYGLTPAARHNIAAYIDYFHRMGAIARPIAVEDLFVPTTLG